jgi:molybdopterin adenylyltransferase
MARVISVNTSAERKARKVPRESVMLLKGHGIEGDAHAGEGRRQVSILSDGSMGKMRARGIDTSPGCCGENIDAGECRELYTMLPGVSFRIGDSARVRITEVGKDNSDGHADNVIQGNIFPEEGIFAEVLEGGEVRPGDGMTALRDGGYLAGVLTASDSACGGVYPDESGPAVMELLRRNGIRPARYYVEPDDIEVLVSRMSAWCDDGFIDVLFTAGGTGLSPRDVTPEATRRICQREVPGIAELMRLSSSEVTRTAWLSRAYCGIRNRTLVINLPGSLKASVECAGFVLPVLGHALEILSGDLSHCGHGELTT